MRSRIPRRIIQTGKSSQLSLLESAATSNVRLLNPDFQYLFFDDRQVEVFVDENFPEYSRAFRSFRFPIQRYDLFRYLAVYHFGGFYFDLDVFLSQGISSLLDCECVFPFEDLSVNLFLVRKYGIDWQLGNYAFGAIPGHPFLRAVIDNCARAQTCPDWVRPMVSYIPAVFRDEHYIYSTSSPGLITRTLAECGDAGRNVTILFPDDVYDTSTWHQFGEYGVHLMRGTWRKKENALRRRIYWLWWSWMRSRVNRRCKGLGGFRSFEASSMQGSEGSLRLVESKRS